MNTQEDDRDNRSSAAGLTENQSGSSKENSMGDGSSTKENSMGNSTKENNMGDGNAGFIEEDADVETIAL